MTLAVATAWALGTLASPPLLVHVMPWFEASESTIGWHWRMNRTVEEARASGRAGSHFQPLIGLYDSLDPAVIELQVGWIKLSGFDGVLADWYGARDAIDYAMIHARTTALFKVATQAGLTIGVVYEDQTAKKMVEAGRIEEGDVPAVARETGAFLAGGWMRQENWFRLRGKPAVLVFGPQRFGEAEWGAFREGAGEFQLITLHRQHPFAQGAFDWPIPRYGMEYTRAYPERSREWGLRIATAFPRFQDFYEEGGVPDAHPDLPDAEGATYRDTLAAALASESDAVQVATWNDWQEGTQIEPSVEHRFRDLVATQDESRRRDPSFRFRAADLELPLRLFTLRRAGATGGAVEAAAKAVLAGDVKRAARELTRAEKDASRKIESASKG